LFALARGAGGGCNARHPGCLAVSAQDKGDETITFPVSAEQSYFIVVDSYSTNTSPFTLAVTCAP
jgi:hypothetical protein